MQNTLKVSYDKETKIWSGSSANPYFDSNCSIGRVIFHSMISNPKNICQISDVDGKSLTNQEALMLAVRLAQYYKKLGLGSDDIIGVFGTNTTYAMIATLACYLNCTPVHAVNPNSDEATLSHIFGVTKPKLIFCDGLNYEKTRSATKSFNPTIHTLIDHIGGVSRVEDLLQPTIMEAFYRPESLTKGRHQTMLIMCSSGTSGKPKAVCVGNHKLLVTSDLLTNEDVVYTRSTLDWVSGAYALLMSATIGCTLIVTNKPYTTEYFVELTKKYGITFAMLSARYLGALNDCPTATTENLASLRFVSLTGSAVSVPTAQRTQDILKTTNICNGYGMTEANGIAINVGLSKGASVGKLLPGVRVRIVDEDDNNLGPGEVGEVYVHDGAVWNGYYNDPNATKLLQDEHGWFHTGDLAYFDDDHYLFLVDRKKDILKYQSYQYSPVEIEQVIAELPEVADVCVVGVFDYENGDAPGAVIVRSQGSTLTEQQVKDHVVERLNSWFKELHAGVRFVETLPHNANGKLLRNKAKDLFA